MMVRRLVIREVGQDGIIAEYTTGLNKQPDHAGDPSTFTSPLTAVDLDDLRWYLEEYIAAPYAVYEEKGQAVRGRLVAWGEALFAAVFGPGKTGHEVYERAGASATGLAVMSRSTAFLGLPWELLCAPGRTEPLALGFGTIDRILPGPRRGAPMPAGPELRVLMVIARPSGMPEVDYRMVARRVVACLAALGGRISLTVLRPPTRDAFEIALRQAAEMGRPYHIVHFDGHGEVERSGERAGHVAHLAFETATGTQDLATTEWFAARIAAGRVPIVVLSACRSGMAGRSEGEAALAMRVLESGAASVVAMGYAVHAVAAAEFATGFYGTLFAGGTVSEAVAAGRRRMHDHPARPSPKGATPLEDWIVPVHYLRRAVHLPGLRRDRRPTLQGPDAAPLDEAAAAGGMVWPPALAPTGRFVGQDAAFQRLESAMSRQRVVVLHGPAGIGKTELAKAFARWWQITGGVSKPADIVVHRFDPGSATFGLAGMVDAIGLALLGPRFVLDGDGIEQRCDKVLGIMRERPVLLVWDNFESVDTASDAAAGQSFDQAQRAAIRTFVADIAGSGQSALILTSRNEEEWLDDVARVRVEGLTPIQAAELANDLLRSDPDGQARREEPEFADLLDWLGGHPLGLRVLLPQLGPLGPAALLAGLKGGIADLPPGFVDFMQGHLEVLGASLGSAFSRIDDGKALLPALALFESVVDAQVLDVFSQCSSVPGRFARATKAVWSRLLGRLTAAGILTDRGGDLYDLHPAIPAYLTAAWRSWAGDRYAAERAGAEAALLDAFAQLGTRLTQMMVGREAATALDVIDHQSRTMVRLLTLALAERRFGQALQLLQPLSDLWKTRGCKSEARLWLRRVQDVVGRPDAGPTGAEEPTELERLWCFAASTEASLALEDSAFAEAERIYDELQAVLEPSRGPWRDRQVAAILHQRGLLAQKRGDYAAAERWCRESLAIKQALNDHSGIAATSHQLGRVTEARGELAQAHALYAKSVEIKEELDEWQSLAPGYRQLAIVSHRRGLNREAEWWCRKALAIYERLGDRPGLAASYNLLGIVAYSNGELGEAEAALRRSLDLSTSLTDREALAKIYHMLGMVAGKRDRLDEARSWYRLSLNLKEELGDRVGVASTYHQLGNLAAVHGPLAEAAEWYERSLRIRRELGDRQGLVETETMLDEVRARLRKPDAVASFGQRSPPVPRRQSEGHDAQMLGAPPFSAPPTTIVVGPMDPVTCRFQAEMPKSAVLGRPARLEVRVSQDALARIPAGSTLQEKDAVVAATKPILVQAIAHFNCTILGEDRAVIAVPAVGDVTRLVFEIEGLATGKAEVWVEVRQGPETLALLQVQPVFTKTSPRTEKVAAATAHARPRDSEADHLVLRIYEERRQGGGFRLQFNLDCRKPSINRTARTEEYSSSCEALVGRYYKTIEETRIFQEPDHARLVERLRAAGTQIYDELVPAEVRRDLWTHRKRIGAIQVVSEEPFLPWETLCLADPDGKQDGADFMGDLGLVRWLHNVPWPCEHIKVGAGRVHYVRPDYPTEKMRLPGAIAEVETLRTTFPGARCLAAHSDQVGRFLKRGGRAVDILHVACHATAPVDDARNAHLHMTGRIESYMTGSTEHHEYVPDPLMASQVYASARLGNGDDRPLVFLNACQAGRTGRSLDRMGGFATAFLAPKSGRGAGVFIGSLWSVDDAGASTFASAFYRDFKSGKRLADAVRRARRVASKAKEPSWLSYTVYGHPDARIVPRADTGEE